MQHHGAALRDLTTAELAAAIAADWRTADIAPRWAALLDYAERLTTAPATLGAGDIDDLRAAGLGDEAILHACEIAAYFNFVNRLADGLGVELEPDWGHPIIG